MSAQPYQPELDPWQITDAKIIATRSRVATVYDEMLAASRQILTASQHAATTQELSETSTGMEAEK